MSNNIRLTVKSSKIVFRLVPAGSFLVIQWLIIVFLLLPAIGCRDRKTTTPTPQMETDQSSWVRILLFDNITECELEIDSTFSIEQLSESPSSESTETAFKKPEKPIKILVNEGQLKIGERSFGKEQILITPGNPYIFSINDSSYRGKIKLVINPGFESFDVINLVPMESYIAGVAGAEMPDYWEPEALKCQVIAARTYCLFIKKRFGTNRQWDVNKTAAHQVYRGIEAESAAIWSAVNNTAGMVLTCKQENGKYDIFPTYYSSACGGHTENSQNVFGDSYKPLCGVPCEYCKDVAKPEIFFWKEVRFDKKDVIANLMNRYPNINRLGENLEITIEKENKYDKFSRLITLGFSDSKGNHESLRAEDFRLTIDPSGQKIRSATCKLEITDDELIFKEGRGWGHSVGMCQCGVEGMARKEKTAKEILKYYYPDSKIVEIEYKE